MYLAKRRGFAEYSSLAQDYVENFERKWVLGTPSTETLLGSPDIQSLADLGHSYNMVREMNMVPFGTQDIIRLAVATAAPLLPLLLFIFSPEEIVLRIARILF
jgi:hypothetical protein